MRYTHWVDPLIQQTPHRFRITVLRSSPGRDNGFAAERVPGRERCVLSSFLSLTNVIRNTDHSSRPLLPRDDARIHNGDLPLSVCPTPDSSILVDLHAPACKRLTSNNFSPHEIISLIETIFTTQDEIKMIGCLRGDEAQTFIDVIHEVHSTLVHFRGAVNRLFSSLTLSPRACSPDQALDLPNLPPRLRRKCLSALCRICGRQALLPKSLQIPLCYDRSDTPLYRGGYADVWKGEYQGRSVAVKVLRVYSTSDFEKITCVGSTA